MPLDPNLGERDSDFKALSASEPAGDGIWFSSEFGPRRCSVYVAIY
jgi:hypothetical protein